MAATRRPRTGCARSSPPMPTSRPRASSSPDRVGRGRNRPSPRDITLPRPPILGTSAAQECEGTSMYGSIRIRGARENNLKNVSLDIPKRQITVFTGVSGSGKSSLVFGTIAAESQRLINETYPAFVQQFMPHYGQPAADELENISAAIVVDQQRIGGNSRSTVATVTDAAQMLRVIFSRIAEPALPSPGQYSYNDPRGMCPDCEGIGQVAAMDMSAVLDAS